MDKAKLSLLIAERIGSLGISSLRAKYLDSGKINFLVIDDLLPKQIAESLCASFPAESQLRYLDGAQEKKFVGVDFNGDQKLIEECLYAFQEPIILEAFSEICGIKDLEGDPELYAGGVSSMSKGCFLNPHIDNSHDRLKRRYRRLNLLYYVNKEWQTSYGGQLLLFPFGINADPVQIDPKFNRLVVMRTDSKSLHGVKSVTTCTERRLTISNYYFSNSSPSGRDYYHSTSFRGFKGEKRKDVILRLNSAIRTTLKTTTGNIIGRFINTGHFRRK